MSYIVIEGGFSGVFDFFGPFDTSAEATSYAEQQNMDLWQIVELRAGILKMNPGVQRNFDFGVF